MPVAGQNPRADPVPQWAGSWVLSLRPAAHAFLSAPRLSSFPSHPVTSTVLSACRVPVPLTSVTLFALKSCSTPVLSFLTFPSLYSRILSYSYRTFSAKCRTARPPSSPVKLGRMNHGFGGIQPRFRQVPPTSLFSTTATERPSLAPLIAAT